MRECLDEDQELCNTAGMSLKCAYALGVFNTAQQFKSTICAVNPLPSTACTAATAALAQAQ